MNQLHTLGYLAIILFTGLLCGRLVKCLKLPNVTGYLLGGLLIGPSCLRILPMDLLEEYTVISEAALGFIAFSIGGQFKWSYLKKIGPAPVIIALLEAMGAVILVFVVLVATGHSVPFSLVLSAIAAATAPAATMMVVNQYKAKGPVTDTLLTVVAVDDAVALMAFGVCVALASAFTGTGDQNILLLLLKPIYEIVIALLGGFGLGCLMCLLLRFFQKNGNRLVISVGFVFLATAIADLLQVSALLFCMALGAMVANLYRDSDKIMAITDGITPPIFLAFFVISGAELDLAILPQIGLVGVIYVGMRVLGKLGGAALGARWTKSAPSVCKYLGWTLLPQAGVAIGLSLLAGTVVPEYAPTIQAVVLCATLIYELVGPAITKTALVKAGEIQ